MCDAPLMPADINEQTEGIRVMQEHLRSQLQLGQNGFGRHAEHISPASWLQQLWL